MIYDMIEKRFRDSPAGNRGDFSWGGERVDENMDSLSEIRRLTPEVVDMMGEMLRNAKTPAVVKVRIMEIILERTFGKPEAAIRLSTAQQNVEAAQERISAIVSQIRIGGGD